jgi:hypothetical protein
MPSRSPMPPPSDVIARMHDKILNGYECPRCGKGALLYRYPSPAADKSVYGMYICHYCQSGENNTYGYVKDADQYVYPEKKDVGS